MSYMDKIRQQQEERDTRLEYWRDMERTKRMASIDAYCEAYFAEHGTMPDVRDLERMADAILHEELSDRDPDKITNGEYPIMSERQFERRDKRKAPIELTEMVGSDGRKYAKPVRQKRGKWYYIHADEKTRARNAERRKRYEQARKPGEVITYKMDSEKPDA